MKTDFGEAIENELKLAFKSETAAEQSGKVKEKKKKTDYPVTKEMIGAELETVEENKGKKKT